MVNVKILFNYITIKTTEYICVSTVKDCGKFIGTVIRSLWIHDDRERFCCKRSTNADGKQETHLRGERLSQSRRWRDAACIRRIADGKRSFVGRRPVNLIFARSFVRYVCTCITMIVRAAKKKSETFETSFSQTSGSDNGVKKTRPVECTACDVEVSKCSTRL